MYHQKILFLKFRNDIQGLRALAVIAVILFHLDHKWLPGGFIGVDIFFVISGFLISKSIILQSEHNSFKPVRFYQGRFKRIVPAYLLMMIGCIAIAVFNFPKPDFDKFFYQAKAALLFFSNQEFSTTLDYFGTANHENLLLHTWSLSIEMQFYLFLPLIYVLFTKKFRTKILILLFVLFLAFTEYQLHILGNQSKMYFSLLPRSLEFMFGIALNYIPKSDPLSKSQKNIVGFLSLMMIVASLFLLNENSIFPGWLSFPVCLGTAGIVWAASGKINDFFSTAPLVYVGKISYSLYLWHWPVLAFYRYKTMNYEIERMDMLWLVPVFTAFSLLSFYLVEEPFRRLKGRKLLQYGFIACVFAAVIWRGSNYSNRKLVNIPEPYVKYVPFINHNRFLGYMLIGDTAVADQKILLIGDSHCLSMLEFFDTIGKSHQLNFSFLSTASVVPIPGYENFNFPSLKEKERHARLSKIGDQLIEQSDIVLLIRNWIFDYDFSLQTEYLENKISPSQSLIVLKAYPTLKDNPVRKYLSLEKPDDFRTEEILYPLYNQHLTKSIAEKPNFYLLDLSHNEIYDQIPFINDTMSYYDHKHLNFYGARRLAESAGDEVADLLLKLKNRND